MRSGTSVLLHVYDTVLWFFRYVQDIVLDALFRIPALFENMLLSGWDRFRSDSPASGRDWRERFHIELHYHVARYWSRHYWSVRTLNFWHSLILERIICLDIVRPELGMLFPLADRVWLLRTEHMSGWRHTASAKHRGRPQSSAISFLIDYLYRLESIT